MSSGPQSPPPEPVLKTEDFSRDVAKQWCNEVRVYVFGRGIKGTTDKLDKANVKAHKQLDELDELFPDDPPDDVKLLEKKYKETAIRLKHLQDEYVGYELAKTNAEKNIKGKFVIKPFKTAAQKKSSEENAKSVQNAEKGMNNVSLLLTRETDELALLAQQLTTRVSDEKQRRKQAEEGLSKPEKEKISAAEKLLKTGNKLIRFFDDCDAGTAAGIRAAYGAKTKDDWYVTTYDRSALVTDLTDLNSAWELTKGEYQTGKRSFDKNFDAVQKELQAGQELLGETELNKLLTKFYKGQDAALAKKWNDAGLINPTFLGEIQIEVRKCQADYDAWMDRKNNEYPDLKTDLNTIGDPKFTMLALQRLADVTASAEKDRKFAEAVSNFDAAKAEALEVLAVARAYPAKRTELQLLVDSLTTDIGLLPAAAQSLAERLKQQAAAAVAKFDTDRYVKTTVLLETETEKARQALAELKTQVEALNDPNKVNEEVAKLKATNDVSPFINTLTDLIAARKVQILEYLGYGYDPLGDATKKTTWEGIVTAAETFLTELQQVKKAGTTDKFDALVTETGTHQSALQTLQTTIETAVTDGGDTLEAKRTQLRNKLDELQVSLKKADHLVTTATWHRDASAELLKLRAAEGASSCDVIQAALDRGTKLNDQVTGYTGAKSELSKRYDTLKSEVEKVQKALTKKEFTVPVPTATAALAEEATEVLAELRKAGPGLANTEYADNTESWNRLTKLTTDLGLLRTRAGELTTLRDECNVLITDLKRNISGELTEKIISANGGKAVNPASLPISITLAELEPRVTAEKTEELKTLKQRLGNLVEELDLLVNEEPTALAELAEEAADTDKEAQDRNDAIRKLQGEYNRDLDKYNEVLAEIKKLKGVDKTEKKRLMGLQKDAKKSAKINDWAGAARKMGLALRMAETLKSDPKASEVTGRGNSELKKLNPRWKTGIELVRSSVADLQAEINRLCLEDDEIKNDVDKVTTPFQDRVVARFTAELKPDMFQQELLVLQAEDAKGEAKEKDREKKKKYREQALAKVRRLTDLISRDPIFTSVMMSANPFKKRVAGIQVMRALNDLDLNLQRSV